MCDRFFIVGCGGHARSVADVYLANHPDAKLVFVDQNAIEDETILGFPVVKNVSTDKGKFFIAIGDNEARAVEMTKYNFLETIVSKRAYIGRQVKLDQGVFVAHDAILSVQSQVGLGCIINTLALLEHEVVIGNFCHIAPNSTVCGRSRLGDKVFLGAGATVIDKINICDHVYIGAGAVVTRNISEPGLYIGNPLRKLR